MASPAQPATAQPPLHLRIALVTVGFSAVIGQIILMRELLVASYGNELSLGIMLAAWLAFTAVGSNLFGRLFRRKLPSRVLAALLTASALAIYFAIFLVRSSRAYWNASPGEALGPVPIIVTTLFTLAIYCPLSGWLFTAGSRCYAEHMPEISYATSSMYLLEAIGSAVGGLLASLLLLRLFDSLQIATIIALVNVLVAIFLTASSKLARTALTLIVLIAGATMIVISSRLELQTVARSWPGFHVVAARISPYGALAVVETEGNRSVIQNGTILFTVPDLAAAEEAVHFPLLQHPSPRTVLLIGGGLNGSIAEILKYPTVERVDYVELDPAVIRISRDHFPQLWASLIADRRIHIHELDGRLFLNSTPLRFDVVILSLPEPQTAQINRFYTEESFQEVSAHLNPGGVFGFQMHASEEYLNPQMKAFLRCLNATLQRAFAHTITIPGEVVHFIATAQPALLTTDPQLLLTRLDQRGVRTTFFRDYYLPFRITPERVTSLAESLKPTETTRINRDFVPIAYFFNIELWSTQFNSRYRDAFNTIAKIPFAAVIWAIFALLLISAVTNSSRRVAAGYSVAMMGLTLMVLEILLLLGFQAVYGYVFNELALIIAGFMIGMATGSWLALRHTENRNSIRLLWLTQVAAVVVLLAVTPLIVGMGKLTAFGLPTIFLHAVFLVFAVLCGIVGGFQFPIGMRIFSHVRQPASPGTLYGLDLFGACVGALVISMWLIPVFGFYKTAGIVALANLGPILLAARTPRNS
ncbi:MAG TPA: fused MFS/spermidine synthase [Terriglobales bacterium]|nr:fused MFS/spermidine synthase [Terriglobales bacterium]